MNKRVLTFIFIIICILPILILREYTPSNELRYLNIVDNALEEGHLFAFYDHGVPYADKPPLYFWCAMLLKLIFGKHYIFLLSLLSVIPAFVIANTVDKWMASRLKEEMRVATILMLFTTVIFIGSTIVLRMDMLMCMFIILALWEFCKLYKNTKGARDFADGHKNHESSLFRRGLILLPIYTFLAIFSKGAIGFLVPVLTIIFFLLSEKEIRIGRYLGKRFWAILFGLLILWIAGIYLDGGVDYIKNLFVHQTVGRAVNSFHHKKAIWYYLATYWYIFAPWSLLCAVAIFKGFQKRLIWGVDTKLMASCVISSFVLLSLISSKIAIYTLPIVPFTIYLAASLIEYFPKSRSIKFSILLVAILYIVIFGALLFAKSKIASIAKVESLPTLWIPYWILSIIFLIGALIAIKTLKENKIASSIISLSATLLIVIFLSGFSMPTLNKMMSAKDGCELATKIAKERDKKLLYYNFSAAPNLDYYFKQENLSIEEITDLQDKDRIENSILFFKHRNIKRDSLLREIVSENELHITGDNINFIVLE